MLKRKLSKNVFLIINILLAKVGSGKFGKFNIIKHVIYMQWNKCLNLCKLCIYYFSVLTKKSVQSIIN
jgi:hypothetical protein